MTSEIFLIVNGTAGSHPNVSTELRIRPISIMVLKIPSSVMNVDWLPQRENMEYISLSKANMKKYQEQEKKNQP